MASGTQDLKMFVRDADPRAGGVFRPCADDQTQIESPGTRARPTDTGMMSLQAPFSSGLRWSRNWRKTP